MVRFRHILACSLLLSLLTLFSGLAMHWHRATAHGTLIAVSAPGTPGTTTGADAHKHSHDGADHGHYRCGHTHHHHHHADAGASPHHSSQHSSDPSPAAPGDSSDHDCRMCDLIAGVIGESRIEASSLPLFELSHRLAPVESERAAHLIRLTLRAGRGPPTSL
ncbi:MAG: hypothetical protein WD768_07515 [Phycisphaeraceae bacterium]